MAKEVKSVVFKNFDREEFVCSWDGTPYRFPPGKEMYVEDWKAEHFAKHLIDKIMNRNNQITSNKFVRDQLLPQALPPETSISTEEALDLNAREKLAEVKAEEKVEEIKKKKTSKKVVEEEFEGLKK